MLGGGGSKAETRKKEISVTGGGVIVGGEEGGRREESYIHEWGSRLKLIELGDLVLALDRRQCDRSFAFICRFTHTPLDYILIITTVAGLMTEVHGGVIVTSKHT